MKNKIVVFAAVIVFGFSGLAMAQMNDKGKEMMQDKAGMMMGKDGMKGDKDKMMDMHGMMMNHAMGPSMVATSDGGVVVLSGCALTKYDKNLKEVKEVQLKCGMMKKGCPMMGGGKMGMMDNDGDEDDKAEVQVPAADVDHASHH